MAVVDYLQMNATAFVIFSIVLGLIIGSFLNVVSYRLPVMMQRDWRSQCNELLEIEPDPPAESETEPFNLVVPRSRCPHCGHAITALQNIPVISYLTLGGRCAACKTPISARYPLIEFVTARNRQSAQREPNPNHVHAIFRYPGNDFGEDLLRLHYENSPHHQNPENHQD